MSKQAAPDHGQSIAAGFGIMTAYSTLAYILHDALSSGRTIDDAQRNVKAAIENASDILDQNVSKVHESMLPIIVARPETARTAFQETLENYLTSNDWQKKKDKPTSDENEVQDSSNDVPAVSYAMRYILAHLIVRQGLTGQMKKDLLKRDSISKALREHGIESSMDEDVIRQAESLLDMLDIIQKEIVG